MKIWWEKHTLPMLRGILTNKMGVSKDSSRLKLLKEDYVCACFPLTPSL
jgi:hypothetical protein